MANELHGLLVRRALVRITNPGNGSAWVGHVVGYLNIPSIEIELGDGQRLSLPKTFTVEELVEHIPAPGSLRWYHGPVEGDPDPGKMWCMGCGGEVVGFMGEYTCKSCHRHAVPGRPKTAATSAPDPVAWLRATITDDRTRWTSVVSATTGFPTSEQARERVADAEAKLTLIDDLMATEHFPGGGEWYGCHALAHGQEKQPTGRACTCGRDEEVNRRLGLLASAYRYRPGYQRHWGA